MSREGPGDRSVEERDRLQGEVAELRRSRRRIAASAHAERQAIERALHDGIQQDLVALAVNLRRLRGQLEGDPVAARALVDEMTTAVTEALDATTDLAQRIYPSLLEMAGLASAIRSAAGRVGVPVVVTVASGREYPPETTAAIYWTCTEALFSASVESQATVRVRDGNGGVTFEIAMNLRDRDRAPLIGLRDRIEAIDGSLDVEDPGDGGLRIHGWLPASR